MENILLNIGGTVFCGFLVYIMNRVYTVLSEMKG